MIRPDRALLTLPLLLLLTGVLALTAGCIKAPQQTGLAAQVKEVDVSGTELRLRTHAHADRAMGVIQEAANQIIARSDDPNVRRNALLWKMNAIPAFQKAAFHYDPLVALIDVRVLTGQMIRFFEEGAGKQAFGEWQGVALKAMQTIEVDGRSMATGFAEGKTADELRPHLLEWVEEHPIESLRFNRVSITPLLAEVTKTRGRGAGAVMGSLDEGIGDLSDRLKIYADTMPNQARWQAELLIDDLLRSGALDETLDDFGRLNELTTTLEALTDPLGELAAEVPELLERERSILLRALREERRILTEFADGQREASFEGIAAERLALLAFVREERIATIDQLHQERLEIMEELDTMTAKVLDASVERTEELIDHLFWRLAQLVGALIVLCALLVFVGLRVLRTS
jgi:hypothetical protein